MSGERPDVDVALPATANSGTEGRRVLDRLRDRLPEQTFGDLRLLVTEVVSNALRHSGAGPQERLRLRVWASPELVRVEVHDPGPGFDPAQRRPRGPDSGWGLYLVETLASRWGVTRTGETCVWFELLPDATRRLAETGRG